MFAPIKLQHFLKLSTTEKISKENARHWFKTVNNKAPNGTVSAYQTVRPKKGLTNVRLIHKTLVNGNHNYIIPLTRDLLPTEIDKIVDAWNQYKIDVDYEIEGSCEDIEEFENKQKNSILIQDYKLENFSNKAAKAMHEKWYNEKVKDGWRFGVKFDQRNRTNPMLKPWSELAEEYKNIDKELPQLFIDLLDREGYVVIKKEDFNNLTKRALTGDVE